MHLFLAILFGLSSYFNIKVFLSLLDTKRSWLQANISNQEFAQKYSKTLVDVYIGCSFAPEMWSKEEIREGKALAGLKVVVEQLGIKDIRLGIRWSEVFIDEKIDLSFYKPFLKYCFKNKVNICLNLGPIKTFRWPEEHIPQQILDKLNSRIKRYSKVDLNSEITTYAYEYLEQLIDKLKAEFTENELENINIIQLENEGFNRMGTFKLRMSSTYFKKIILKANKSFPNSKILVNSPGRFNLKAIIRLFTALKKTYPHLTGKLLIGYDYYYRTEFRDRFILTKLLDSLSFSLPWNISITKLLSLSNKHNFQTEITEAQFEPWGKYLGPGNSSKDFKFMLLRCIKILNLDLNDQNIIRLWGIENFVKKIQNGEITGEHEGMMELIKEINLS
jgi:hypothetical protein